MVLLQSSKKRANSKIILPLVGEASFNEESTICVENHEIANQLISLVPFLDFKIIGAQDQDVNEGGQGVGDKIKKKSEEDELNDKEEGDEIGGESEQDSLPSLKEQLSEASLAQLKDFAEILTKEDDSVKKSDWSKKNKAELLEFLLDKIE